MTRPKSSKCRAMTRLTSGPRVVYTEALLKQRAGRLRRAAYVTRLQSQNTGYRGHESLLPQPDDRLEGRLFMGQVAKAKKTLRRL